MPKITFATGNRYNVAHHGFSLVELLVVVSVIVLISAIAIPAVQGMLSGNHITRSQQTLEQTLSIARQTAISQNRRVEVRLYKFDDPDLVGPESYFRGLQLFLIKEDGTSKPVGKLVKLPGSVVINENGVASPILKVPVATGTLPGIVVDEVKSFHFRPNGSTTLVSPDNFLSAHTAKTLDEAKVATLPPNYVVIQIDPSSGSVRSYRP